MNNESNNSIGEVQIADEVVGSIAALAATEIEGVASLAGNFTKEIAGRFGVKNPGKGVKVDIAGNSVFLDMSLQLLYGYSIPKVSKAVQDRAAQAVENMTGLKVEEVNVKVTGIVTDGQ